jgi:hypothetical protein
VVAGRVPVTREVMETPMHLNRTLLYTGVFLAAIGGALLAVDLGRPETNALIGALRLWPLALIAIGLGIALRRTQISLASGLLAAAVPGLLLGATMAATPRFAVDHGVWDRLKAAYEREYHCVDSGARIDFGNVEIDPIGGCK